MQREKTKGQEGGTIKGKGEGVETEGGVRETNRWLRGENPSFSCNFPLFLSHIVSLSLYLLVFTNVFMYCSYTYTVSSSIYLYITFVFISIYWSICLSLILSICLSIILPLYIFTPYISIHLSPPLFIHSLPLFLSLIIFFPRTHSSWLKGFSTFFHKWLCVCCRGGNHS